MAYLDEERGRRTRLAAELGISPSAISMWSRVPEDHLGKIARITGIPPQDLRPDLAELFLGAVEPDAGQAAAAEAPHVPGEDGPAVGESCRGGHAGTFDPFSNFDPSIGSGPAVRGGAGATGEKAAP